MASSRAHQVLNPHNAALFSAAEGEAAHPSTTALSQHQGLPGASGHAGLWCWRMLQPQLREASTALPRRHGHGPAQHSTAWPALPCPAPHHVTASHDVPTAAQHDTTTKVSILTFIKKSFDVQKYAGEGCELFLIL